MPSKRAESFDVDTTSSKKRRKALSSSSSKAAPAAFDLPDDPYEAAVMFEEKEANMRTSKEDTELFHKTCEKIKAWMDEIRLLKKTPGTNQSRISELRCQAGLAVLTLKKVNRLEKLRLAAARDRTYQAKQKVDTFHLTLQNLLYEVVHVRKEINRCLECKSRDEDIELVSVEDFMRDAPEEINKTADLQEDRHRLHLARLDWELEQRKRLAEQCQQLNADQLSISQLIAERHQRLSNLTPQLAAILETTRPLQKELSLPVDQRREQHQLAQLLPRTLFILYVQMSAYAEACDRRLAVSVAGNEAEALSVKQAESSLDPINSDSEPEPDEDAPRKKRHTKSMEDEEGARLKKMLQKHPLEVVVKLSTKDCGCLVLTFAHLMRLDIIIVTAALDKCPTTGRLVSCDSLLDRLLDPCDTGLASPRASTDHLLRRHGLPQLPRLLQLLGTGRPYRWAQPLAGLQLVAAGPEQLPREATSFQSVPGVVQAVRRRLLSRVVLQKQLNEIAANNIPMASSSSDGDESQLPAAVSQLVSWSALSREKLAAAVAVTGLQLPAAEAVLANGCADDTGNSGSNGSSGFYYLAVLQRADARLSCYISISDDHPRVWPLFCLQLNCDGQTSDARTYPLRAVECELNTALPEGLRSSGDRDSVLPTQLQWARRALDVIMETRVPSTRPSIVLQPRRGPERLPPLFYTPSLGMFTHSRPTRESDCILRAT